MSLVINFVKWTEEARKDNKFQYLKLREIQLYFLKEQLKRCSKSKQEL